MKSRSAHILIAAMLAISFCGCGAGMQDSGEISPPVSEPPMGEFSKPEEEPVSESPTDKSSVPEEEIVAEEADGYFTSGKDMEQVIDIIQRRVQNYLDERK